MDIVRVNVMTTPRVLADLIASAIDSPGVRRWTPGDLPALVTIVNADPTPATDSRVTIVLSDHLDDPVSVIVDGQRSSREATRPAALNGLILELAGSLPPEIDISSPR